MILLDTHVVIWLAQEPEKLPSSVLSAIRAARESDGAAISDQTLWELALLVSRGRLKVQTSLRDFLQAVERKFAVLPITAAISERATRFSSRYPKDPADRLIGATALEHGISLVTRDTLITASGEVKCMW